MGRYERRLARDDDTLAQGAELQLDVDDRVLPDRERQVRVLRRPESLELDGHFVLARRECLRAVPAARVGDHDALLVGLDVPDRHRRARHGCVSGVGHES